MSNLSWREVKKRALASGIAILDESKKPWGRGCKIGTIPAYCRIHGADLKKLSPGNWIRIKEREDARKWTKVLVQKVMKDGWFQADR